MTTPTTSPAPAEPAPELPSFVQVGPLLLERVAGDDKNELVFVVQLDAISVWLKSPNLLAGPWDWIVMSPDNRPIDFRGPFKTRDEASADLVDFLNRYGYGRRPSTNDAELWVEAAETSDRDVIDAELGPGPRAEPSDDRDVIAHALDFAIATLRTVRRRIGAHRG